MDVKERAAVELGKLRQSNRELKAAVTRLLTSEDARRRAAESHGACSAAQDLAARLAERLPPGS